MKMSYDYLPGTEIYLHQRKDMFCMNTDTALLGHFMKIRENESVLDIGTNNGALLLYASCHTKGRLVGVDVLPEACQLAKLNLCERGIESFEIICEDIRNFSSEPFDVILCNPPYFRLTQDGNVNVNEYKKTARHEGSLTLEVLCAKASELLKEKGRFYLVHRADRIVDLCCCLRACELEIKTMQMVRDEEKENVHGILIEAVKQAKAHCIVKQEKVITR